MSILVTGATGTIGSLVVQRLADAGADVKAEGPLARLALDLVGPQSLTGEDVAKAWTKALGRDVFYAGDDVVAFETQMGAYSPAWLAYDMRLMMSGIQELGMRGEDGAVARLESMLGRPLRKYADFVREATESMTA